MYVSLLHHLWESKENDFILLNLGFLLISKQENLSLIPHNSQETKLKSYKGN